MSDGAKPGVSEELVTRGLMEETAVQEAMKMAKQVDAHRSKAGLLGEIAGSGRLVWRLLTDRRVPLLSKVVIPGVFLAYLLWPLDLMPDVIPVIGQLDDLALLALALKLFVDLCPADIVRHHRESLRRRDPVRSDEAPGEVVDAEYRVVE